MNRGEKEAVAVLVTAVAALAAMCILSFQQCITALIFSAAATLWAYAWIFFAEHLVQKTEERRDAET